MRGVFRALVPPIVDRGLQEISWSLKQPAVRRAIRNQPRLHLGCGFRVLPDWTNLDLAVDPGVTHWDLSRGLPADDDSVEFVYSEHFIEHLPLNAVDLLLRECFRSMKPGATLRVSTPSLEHRVRCYVQSRIDEFGDVEWKPTSACRLLNEGMRSWGHQFMFDRKELSSSLQDAGFAQIEPRPWRESSHAQLRNLESRPFHDDLILEASKPL